MIGRRGLVGAALAALASRGKKKPVANSWSNTGTTLIVIQETVTGFSGIFGYSPTIGHGNLVFSVAANAGTDPYGNDYVAGVTSYDEGAALLFTQMAAGILRIGRIDPGGGPDLPLAALLQAGLTGITNSLTVTSPTGTVTFTDPAYLTLVAGAPGATTGQPGVPRAELFDADAASPVDLWASGTAIKLLGPDVPYTWQDPTSLLGAGWAIGPNSGSAQPLQYRKDALDNLVLVGSVHSTSNAPATTLFTLPSGYRPAQNQRVVCVSNLAGTPTVRFLQVNANGGVLVMNNVAATGTDVYIEATLPFGNIA